VERFTTKEQTGEGESRGKEEGEEKGEGVMLIPSVALEAMVKLWVSEDLARYAPLLSNILPVIILDNEITERVNF
jgi:hypothetical protein